MDIPSTGGEGKSFLRSLSVTHDLSAGISTRSVRFSRAGSWEVETNQSIPAREVERMMKLQDVLLKAMAKKISWLSAAEIIGVTPRTMRRWRARLEQTAIADCGIGARARPASVG